MATNNVNVSNAVHDLRQLRPKWEGLYSFDKAWDSTVSLALENEIVPGTNIFSTRSGVAARTARILARSMPLNFGKAQLEAVLNLCRSDGVDPFEFLREHRAAFDLLFLDYSDIGIHPTMVQDAKGAFVELYGASYWRSSDENLSIVPFGARMHVDDEIGHIVGQSDGENQWPLPAESLTGSLMILDDVEVRAPAKAFIGYHDQEQDDNAMEMQCIIPVRCLPDLFAHFYPDLGTKQLEDLRNVPGDVLIGVGGQPALGMIFAEELLRAERELGREPTEVALDSIDFMDLPRRPARAILADAVMVLKQSEAVIDSLYFLDSHNVAIEDATVSRQVRRRAERSGGEIQIAQVVRVGPTKIRRTPTKDKGGTANYSHRFERRGYTRHVTKGSHAKADLIQPCYRRDAEGNLTCPNGCRREWVPPTIVGDEELPFVPKTRVVPGPNTEN